jgi:hypothetical protein
LPGLIGKSGARLVQGVICRALSRLFLRVIVSSPCLSWLTRATRILWHPRAKFGGLRDRIPAGAPVTSAETTVRTAPEVVWPEVATANSSWELTVGSSSRGKPTGTKAVSVATRLPSRRFRLVILIGIISTEALRKVYASQPTKPFFDSRILAPGRAALD